MKILHCRWIKSGRIRSIEDLVRISDSWFKFPEHALINALDSLIREKIVRSDLKLTKVGHLIAKHYVTVNVYTLLKPLIVKRRNRKEKLELIAETVFKLRPASYYVRNDRFLKRFSKNAKMIISQLMYKTGDTIHVAETIKKLSNFLYDVTRDKDWLILSECMDSIVRNEFNAIRKFIG